MTGKKALLDDSLIQQFFTEGYFLIKGMIPSELMREVSSAFDRIYAEAKTLEKTQLLRGSQFVVESGRVDRVVWCGALEPVLLRVAEQPALLQAAAQLLGSNEMEQLISQAHFKLPGDGVSFRWHQDSENRRYGTPEWVDVNGKGSFVQTILAVDSAADDNAPLVLQKESCQFGHLALDKNIANREKVDPSKMVSMHMEPGDVLFLHPFTIHGSEANRSNRPRRVLINGYCSPGANFRVYPGEGAGRKLRI